MRRSDGYPSYPTKHENGQDYYSHVHRLATTPSVLTDVPHHPHGQTLYNNQAPGRENYGGQYYEQRQQKQHHIPEVHKTVEVTERVTQCDANGNCVVFEETVDVDEDDYIEQKRKGFELSKWRMFKAG
ncbi:hypothetical protein ACFX2I_015259 [Malus domestica]